MRTALAVGLGVAAGLLLTDAVSRPPAATSVIDPVFDGDPELRVAFEPWVGEESDAYRPGPARELRLRTSIAVDEASARRSASPGLGACPASRAEFGTGSAVEEVRFLCLGK